MTSDLIARIEAAQPGHVTLRESIIHGLRMKGWSRIDAENEAEDRSDRTRLTQSKGRKR